MTRAIPSRQQLRRDEALLKTVMIHGVPVRVLAHAVGVSRQTIYRRMQRARTNLRRACDAARVTGEGVDL